MTSSSNKWSCVVPVAPSYETTCCFIWTMWLAFIELIYFTPEDCLFVWQHWAIPGCWLTCKIFCYLILLQYLREIQHHNKKESLSAMVTAYSFVTFLFRRTDMNMYIFPWGNWMSLCYRARTSSLPKRGTGIYCSTQGQIYPT